MKNKILSCHSLNTEIATFMLRIIFGGLFVYHGYTKLLSYHAILPIFPDLIGIGSKASLILVIFAELVCGSLVAIGLLTRLTVIPIFITMSVAFFLAYAKDAFMFKELPFTFLLLSVVIFVSGSGRFSVDKLLSK